LGTKKAGEIGGIFEVVFDQNLACFPHNGPGNLFRLLFLKRGDVRKAPVKTGMSVESGTPLNNSTGYQNIPR